MDKIIVYLDDADHALQQLVPMKNVAQPNAEMQTTQWVLVACAPRMTRHISKWVSHSARENWRASWSEKLFAQIVPVFKAQGDTVTTVVAKGPLPTLTERLSSYLAMSFMAAAYQPALSWAVQVSGRGDMLRP